MRFGRVVITLLGCAVLWSCKTEPKAPSIVSPLPLASRIHAVDPNNYATVNWQDWKNPQLIVNSQGVEVLLSGAAKGPVVTPEEVGNILERTTTSDWPLGLVVMVETAGMGSGDPTAPNRNRAELLSILRRLGIPVQLGPPSA